MLSGWSGQPLAKALKLDYIPITRVENFCATGTDAFRNACFAVASGAYEMVMVAGVEKLKDTGFTGLASPLILPNTNVESPAPPPAQFALAATAYFDRYGLSFDEGREVLAKIAVKNHHNGSLNPKAHFQREISLEQALRAPMIAWPLGLFDCCGVSDGAAVAIITRPEIARTIRNDYVLVKGLGLAVGADQGTLRRDAEFTYFPENVHAAKEAYDQAGISDPRKEISVAEVHDCFTITELILYEDLGFSPRGRAADDVQAGAFTPRRRPPRQHGRRAEVLRPSHRGQRRAHDVRDIQAVAGAGRAPPGAGRRDWADPQPRRLPRIVYRRGHRARPGRHRSELGGEDDHQRRSAVGRLARQRSDRRLGAVPARSVPRPRPQAR